MSPNQSPFAPATGGRLCGLGDPTRRYRPGAAPPSTALFPQTNRMERISDLASVRQRDIEAASVHPCEVQGTPSDAVAPLQGRFNSQDVAA